MGGDWLDVSELKLIFKSANSNDEMI
jgi:hypothetical protein